MICEGPAATLAPVAAAGFTLIMLSRESKFVLDPEQEGLNPWQQN
jgi:hypothetical protein